MTRADAPFHVLFVEDDEVDIQSVQREIVKYTLPLELTIAKDGIEALDKLYGTNGAQKMSPLPNLILLDINMPRMNGIEFLKKIQADSEFKYIPVFFLTTAYTTNDKVATKGLRVTGTIIKPLQYEDLMQIYWTIRGKGI